MTTQEAIQFIIRFETSPIYLHEKSHQYEDAKIFIDSLEPGEEYDNTIKAIEKGMEDYHTEIPGMNGATPADMDQAVLNG